MDKHNITWKDTLTSHHRFYGTIDQFFLNYVLPMGYPYFEWNGHIYAVTGGDDYTDTYYTEQDIK